MSHPERITLARLPTPLEPLDRISDRWGGPRIYVKRDDLTGFGLSGNKVRKLEYHMAAAMASGARRVVTCGAVQSNHSRATAVAAARLGLDCELFLRTPDGSPPPAITGNHLIDRLVGATVRFVDRDWYRDRDAHMAQYAGAGPTTWVIPEGASDSLGMWGYVRARQEVQAQLDAVGIPAAVHWHAASSGGTTAGLAQTPAGAEASRIVAVSVSDPREELESRVRDIRRGAFGDEGASRDSLEVIDEYVGRGYGISSAEELDLQAEFSAATGLLLDPTYSGKALFGLRKEIELGRLDPDTPVVFWHTGGGFALFA